MSDADFLPYGRPTVSEEDIEAVIEVLRSTWLTTGPRVKAFEAGVAAFTGAEHAVAVSNGTAALHAMMNAIGIQRGDEVIVPAMTFAATANAVVYQGGTPTFADVDPHTLLVDVHSVEERITPHTRAIVAVDYAGQPCDYDALRAIADRHGLRLLADGCHAIGATYRGRGVGTLAELTAFSFHPVKHITTGEGGMITTGDAELAERMRAFRNHGITSDHRQREEKGTWFYEMQHLGFNYRLSDLQCALGLSQLRNLPAWLRRRSEIAALYDAAFADMTEVTPLETLDGVTHAYHLYVVMVKAAGQTASATRERVYAALREAGIGANVHYIPVHLHPYYRETFGTGPGMCPNAEAAYERILTLPMYPTLSEADVMRVVGVVKRAVAETV